LPVASWRARVAVLATAAVLQGAFGWHPTPAGADPIADKQAEAQRLSDRLDQLGTRAEQLAERYNAATVAASKVQSDVDTAAADLAAANEQLATQRQALNEVAVRVYVSGADTASAADITDISDVAVEQTYVQSIVAHQQDALDGLRAARLEVGERQQRLAQAQAVAKAALASVSNDRNQAARADALNRAELSKVNAELASLVAEARARKAAADAARMRQVLLRQQQVATASRSRTLALAAAPTVSSFASPIGSAPSVPASRGAAAALAAAEAQLGKPYQWAAGGPTSFDCSGLTMYAWRAAGVALPHNTSAQFAATTHIPISALQPGDLVYFGSDLHHMGIYIGNGQMIHAPQTGENVQIASIYRGDLVAASRPSA
jgi:cell wall-associated NlpC family hydrolase